MAVPPPLADVTTPSSPTSMAATEVIYVRDPIQVLPQGTIRDGRVLPEGWHARQHAETRTPTPPSIDPYQQRIEREMEEQRRLDEASVQNAAPAGPERLRAWAQPAPAVTHDVVSACFRQFRRRRALRKGKDAFVNHARGIGILTKTAQDADYAPSQAVDDQLSRHVIGAEGAKRAAKCALPSASQFWGGTSDHARETLPRIQEPSCSSVSATAHV